jgi:hypothetical protein
MGGEFPGFGEGNVNLYEEMRRKIDADLAAAFGMPAPHLALERGAFTIDTLRAVAREMKARDAMAPPRIVFTTTALEATTERLFPASRHRSERIRKKLIKRFGGEFRKRPAMWRVGNVIYAHPSFRARLDAAIPAAPMPDRTNSSLISAAM